MSVHNPARAIVGHCPRCHGVVVVLNNHEVWDPATCPCGWAAATTALLNHTRLERGSLRWEDGSVTRVGGQVDVIISDRLPEGTVGFLTPEDPPGA